jgi:hypothetical protein
VPEVLALHTPKYPIVVDGIDVKFCALELVCEPPEAAFQVIDWRAYEPPETSEPPVVVGSAVCSERYCVPVNAAPSMVLAVDVLRRATILPFG